MVKSGYTGFLLLLLLSISCKTAKNPQTNMFPVFDKEGHRGCRGLMPENTIPAMIKAIDLGVTTLEMDVVFTSDKIPVLSHEPFFNHEITTAPGGKEVLSSDESNLNIYRMSFAETQQYDVGMKANAKFPRQQKIKTTKPSLAALIDSVEIYLSIQNLPKVFLQYRNQNFSRYR
jgi:glycerophosphoryl diester phosphodiesterase